MTTIYKYLAIGGVALALLVGAFFYGLHLGNAAGAAKVNALRASIASQTAQATAAAANAQKAADAAAIAEATQAVAQANQAVTARARDLSAAQYVIARLKREVQSYAKDSAEAVWLDTAVPRGLVVRMCLVTGRPAAPNLNCHQGSIPTPPRG